MNDLISRQAAIKCLDMFLDKQCDRERTKARGFSDNDIWAAVKMAYDALSAQRVGKWIECESSEHWKCNQCGDRAPMYWDDANMSYAEWLSPYCPNCGADMRGEEDETDRP